MSAPSRNAIRAAVSNAPADCIGKAHDADEGEFAVLAEGAVRAGKTGGDLTPRERGGKNRIVILGRWSFRLKKGTNLVLHPLTAPVGC